MKKLLFLITSFIVFILIMIPNISALEYNSIQDDIKTKIHDKIQFSFDNFIKIRDLFNNTYLSIGSFFLFIFCITAFRGWCSESLMEGFLGAGGIFGQIIWFMGYFLFPFLIAYSGLSAVNLFYSLMLLADGFWYFMLLPMIFYLLIGLAVPINSIVLPYLGPTLSALWILSRFAYSGVVSIILGEILNIIDIDGNEGYRL